MKKIFAMAAAALMLVACGTKKAEAPAEETPAPKYLVLYYSQAGTTQKVAEEFQKALNADIECVELTDEFPSDYQETIAKVSGMRESGELPAVKDIQSNLEDYDVIFLGYPIWFGTIATPMQSLLKNIDLKGKKVVNFCSFGSGGLIASTNDLKEAVPGIDIVASYGVRTLRAEKAPAEINEFLIRNGFVEGEVEALPGFDEMQPATDEEKAIFDKAISTYEMLNGTVATEVCQHPVAGGVEYLFNAENKNQKMQVWVLQKEGAEPEFTLVERF